MKRIILLLLTLALVCAFVLVCSACTGGEGGDNGGDNGGEEPVAPCEKHTDADSNLICDVCGEVVIPEGPAEVELTFTVSDTDGNPLGGFTVMIKEKGGSATITRESDADGKFTAMLTEGKYEVYYDYDIDTVGYYISDTTEITVSASEPNVTLYLVNNTPNGSVERPFSLTAGEQNELTIPAGSAYYYVVYRSQNYYLSLLGTGVKVCYADNVYAPDADGKVEFALLGTDANSTEIIKIENTTDSDNTFSVEVNSAPGTIGNPIIIDTLGGAVSCEGLESGDIAYYTFTAEEGGVFMITLLTEGGIIKMTNARNSAEDTTADGDGTVTLEVNAGDEIIIEASAGVSGGSVEFIPVLNVPAEY